MKVKHSSLFCFSVNGERKSFIRLASVSILNIRPTVTHPSSSGRHDTWHSDTHHNDTWHSDTHHNDNQINNTPRSDSQNFDNQHNNALLALFQPHGATYSITTLDCLPWIKNSNNR
jgi:hypothetical protein